MTQYAILGASGHGKVVADALIQMTSCKDVIFFDDSYPDKKSLGPWLVEGDMQALIARKNEFQGAVVAIGNNSVRIQKQDELVRFGVPIISVIHPSAIISPFSRIGMGSVVLAGAVINAFAEVGDACILNTNCVVEHDCKISDGVHICPGANLAGAVSIGKESWIGIGATVKQLIDIGAYTIVGAGSVVIKDVANNLTVAGVPAKLIK